MSDADVTRKVRELWSRAAAIYDEAINPALADAQRALLRVVSPTAGERVLDLGCGTGRMGELVAATTRARLAAAVDLSPEMVVRARERLGVYGADVQEMDAQALLFPDATFDVVVASFSLMFCPDHGAALREARRVLRPGGRLAMSVWGMPEECDTVTVGRVAAAFGEGPPPNTPTGQSLGDPVHLEGLLRQTGFDQVALHSRWMRLRYPGPDACWQAVLHVHGERIPVGRLVDAEAATRAEIARVGLPLRNRAWFASAVRPRCQARDGDTRREPSAASPSRA